MGDDLAQFSLIKNCEAWRQNTCAVPGRVFFSAPVHPQAFLHRLTRAVQFPDPHIVPMLPSARSVRVVQYPPEPVLDCRNTSCIRWLHPTARTRAGSTRSMRARRHVRLSSCALFDSSSLPEPPQCRGANHILCAATCRSAARNADAWGGRNEYRLGHCSGDLSGSCHRSQSWPSHGESVLALVSLTVCSQHRVRASIRKMESQLMIVSL